MHLLCRIEADNQNLYKWVLYRLSYAPLRALLIGATLVPSLHAVNLTKDKAWNKQRPAKLCSVCMRAHQTHLTDYRSHPVLVNIK